MQQRPEREGTPVVLVLLISIQIVFFLPASPSSSSPSSLATPPTPAAPAPPPPCLFRIISSHLFDGTSRSCGLLSISLYQLPLALSSNTSYPNASVPLPHPHTHLTASFQWRDRSMRVAVLGCFLMAPLKKSHPDATSSPPRASSVHASFIMIQQHKV